MIWVFTDNAIVWSGTDLAFWWARNTFTITTIEGTIWARTVWRVSSSFNTVDTFFSVFTSGTFIVTSDTDTTVIEGSCWAFTLWWVSSWRGTFDTVISGSCAFLAFRGARITCVGFFVAEESIHGFAFSTAHTFVFFEDVWVDTFITVIWSGVFANDTFVVTRFAGLSCLISVGSFWANFDTFVLVEVFIVFAGQTLVGFWSETSFTISVAFLAGVVISTKITIWAFW